MHFSGHILRTAIATAVGNPIALTTCRALANWLAYYGSPRIIETVQGTHFTSRYTQEYTEEENIQWDFYLSYNPTASGYIERCNGLVKRHLKSIDPTSNFQQELDTDYFKLNQIIRLHKPAPHNTHYTKRY